MNQVTLEVVLHPECVELEQTIVLPADESKLLAFTRTCAQCLAKLHSCVGARGSCSVENKKQKTTLTIPSKYVEQLPLLRDVSRSTSTQRRPTSKRSRASSGRHMDRSASTEQPMRTHMESPASIWALALVLPLLTGTKTAPQMFEAACMDPRLAAQALLVPLRSHLLVRLHE
jgi:hypothetical protein